MGHKHRVIAGFTLVELLIVVAIIGLLAALMLGAVQYSRSSARQVQCQNNFRQIGLAHQLHHDKLNRFCAGWVAPEGWGWGALILPYMDNAGLSENLDVKYDPIFYNATTPPDAGTPGDVSLPFYLCPADGNQRHNPNYSHTRGGPGYAKSNYVASHGDTRFIMQMVNKQTGIFGLASYTTIPEIADGTTNTFLVGERKMSQGEGKVPGAIWIRCINVAGTFMLGSSVVGTCGGTTSDHRRDLPKLNSPQADYWGFSSLHRGGANFVMADASVHFINEDIDHEVYRSLANIKDGKQLGKFFK